MQFDWVCLLACSVILSCFFHGCSGLVTATTILFVDCVNGTDVPSCGTDNSKPCKTLQFTTALAWNVNSTSITISIAPGLCEDKHMLVLDCNKNTTKTWTFLGSNQTSKESTVLQLSVMITKCQVSFSDIQWKTSDQPILFTSFICHITFKNCSLDDSSVQFTAFNTNLFILNMSVNNCSSGDQTLPIFLLETVYNINTGITITNSKFSDNASPIFYIRDVSNIVISNSIFTNNSVPIYDEPILTVGASSVVLGNVTFSQNLGTAIEAKSGTNFTGKSILFLSNKGSNVSCLVLNEHSSITLLQSIFKDNINPVIYTEEKDDIKIIIKECQFGSNSRWVEPFVNVPDGISVALTNCSKNDSSLVYCQNGEMLKLQLLCKKCEPGTFSTSYNNITPSSCRSCPVGSYCSTVGSSECTKCTAGLFAQEEGSTSCRKCSNDLFTSGEGAAECMEITLEFILILVVTIPLIVFPLLVLIGRHVKKSTNKKLAIVTHDQSHTNLTSIQELR